jgi:hypothetical protein
MGLLDMFDSPDIMQSLLGINLYSNNPVSGTDSPPVDMAQSAQAPMALPQPQQDWSAPQDQSSSGLASALGLNPDSAPPPPAAQDPSLATAQPSPLASMAGAAAVPSTMPTGVFPP